MRRVGSYMPDKVTASAKTTKAYNWTSARRNVSVRTGTARARASRPSVHIVQVRFWGDDSMTGPAPEVIVKRFVAPYPRIRVVLFRFGYISSDNRTDSRSFKQSARDDEYLHAAICTRQNDQALWQVFKYVTILCYDFESQTSKYRRCAGMKQWNGVKQNN